MKPNVKLFVLMLLEFFIWGAWLPLIWGYLGGLGFTAVQISLVGSAFAIASVVGDLLQQPVRRPQLRRREVHGGEPPRGRPGHAGAVLHQVVPGCSSR